jgi:putative ABC transport system ATP-binding protein
MEMAAPVAVASPPASPPPRETPLVRVRNLSHSFGTGEGRKQVLFNNNLELWPGEIVIMTGPSGSGKTTLLTIVGALRTVQEGTVEVLGRSMAGLSATELVGVRRNIGFIFQAHNLFASLTAYQNVCMALQLRDGSAHAVHERAVEVLTSLGMANRINYYPESLSGGQRQRVAIARALANRPHLILADEPTAALDANASEDVVRLLDLLVRQKRASILLVTHDNRILNVADRIVNMVDGRIVSDVYVSSTLKICTFLKRCKVFAELSPDALTKVAEKMGCEKFPTGATIIRQGEPGDKFYLIRRGTVEVIKDEGTPQRHDVTTLTESNFFGEIALLRGSPRNATIVAQDEVEAWTLDKPTFEAALASSGSFKDQIYKVLFARQ